MTLADDLRRMGFSAEQIAGATVQGKPLAEAEPKPSGRLPPKRHDLADSFCALWSRLGPKAFPCVREFRFHPERKWRFDAAWPEAKVAVELEGGIWSRGGHVRGSGYRRDMEKYNAAAALGWVVLRYCANDLEMSPVQTVETIWTILEDRLH